MSRRFVAATETALEQLMSRRLDDLDLVAFMVDGVRFGEHTCVVALATGLIAGLRDRGLDVRPLAAWLYLIKSLGSAS